MEKDLLKALPGLSILVVGDVMLDRFIYGSAERISPESPVPVLLYSHEVCMPGGAGNAAVNIASLGARAILCGTTGQDEAAEILRRELEERGIRAELLSLPGRTTSEKSRIVAQQNHQIIRIDREQTCDLVLAQEQELIGLLGDLISEADGVLIADYAKGVISPGICRAIIDHAAQRSIPVVVDPKGRDYSRYRGATVIKPNIIELADAAGAPGSREELVAILEKMLEDLDLQGIVLTRGGEGLTVAERAAAVRPVDIPTIGREVYDVSGAGDTVASILVLALAAGLPLFEAARMANTGAGIAIGKAGTAAVSPAELEQALTALEHSEGHKITDLPILKQAVTDQQARGHKVVFTNGCFDLLHYGHVRYLQNARKQGDFLIVAINADATVRKLKGEDRPVIPEEQRAHLLASLQCVDAVIIFTEDKPLHLLKELQPDILVKGSDYTREGVVGHEIVDGYGGDIYLAPLEDGWSTTALIEKINTSAKE